MRQAIGPYEIDAYTRNEAQDDLKAAMGHHFSQHLIERYRGVKPLKLPVAADVANGTSLVLAGIGPQQGYFWRIGRVTITSSGNDAGAVSLYAGSDPTNLAGQFLIDNSLSVGKAYYPGTYGLFLWPGDILYAGITTVSTNLYRLTGLATEVPAEMAAKILSGG